MSTLERTKLEKVVKRIQEELEVLDQENRALRQSRSAGATESTCNAGPCSPRQRRSRSIYTVPAKRKRRKRRKRKETLSSSQPLPPACFKSLFVEQRIRDCTPALNTSRSNYRSRVAGRYSHVLRKMPRKTLREIFSKLWLISKKLTISRTAKGFLQATRTYQHAQRSLRQVFSKILIASLDSEFVDCEEKRMTNERAMQRRALVIFDRISQKFLQRMIMSGTAQSS